MVHFEHNVRHFKPSGVPLSELDEVNITIDELESLRLSYIEKLKQSEAALRMDVHQSTFQRTLQRTLEKLSDALINGKSIKVEGGNYTMPGKDGTGPRGTGPVAGGPRGQGLGRGQGARARFAGPGGVCVCPNCGHEQPHQAGVPCPQVKCPQCGAAMVRKSTTHG
jgi:hypothetical protein